MKALVPDLLADYDRSGTPVESTKEADPVDYLKEKGAVILANADFDNGGNIRDCDDAVVNGKSDIPDVSQLKLKILGNISAKELKKFTLEIELIKPAGDKYNKPTSQRARLFVDYTATAKGIAKVVFTDKPDAKKDERSISELDGNGEVSLGIEGIDFASEVVVKATLKSRGKKPAVISVDRVRVLVAPLMLIPNTQPITPIVQRDGKTSKELFVSYMNGKFYPRFTKGMTDALAGTGIKEEMFTEQSFVQDWAEFGYTRSRTGSELKIIASFSRLATQFMPYRTGSIGVQILPVGKTSFAGDAGGAVEILPPTAKHKFGLILASDTASPELNSYLARQLVQTKNGTLLVAPLKGSGLVLQR